MLDVCLCGGDANVEVVAGKYSRTAGGNWCGCSFLSVVCEREEDVWSLRVVNSLHYVHNSFFFINKIFS